jgi:glycosyltransferase involved in cell wall biosynthesis
MSPTVSFIVPCYKLAHLLSDCVDSILGQTYREFELLVMDDCSPDKYPGRAQMFALKRMLPSFGVLNKRRMKRGSEMHRGSASPPSDSFMPGI